MEEINGIPCYAPALAFENDGFPPDAAEKLYLFEAKNFWYRTRAAVLKHIIQRYVKEKENDTFLEIGCGTGLLIHELAATLPAVQFTGTDIYLAGLKLARARSGSRVRYVQMDAAACPFRDEFGLAGAFDVLEHIENDTGVLKGLCGALKTGGILFISVPQYQWLWSRIDVTDRHKRRYSKKRLYGKLSSAGFDVVYGSSFLCTLFPLMVVSRAMHKIAGRWQKGGRRQEAGGGRQGGSGETKYPEIDIPGWLNRILYLLMLPEVWLIRMGLRLPFGGSLIVAARKRGEIRR